MPDDSKSIIDVVVVGAGISGLSTALLLHEQGLSVRVLEANPRPGGRVHSVFSDRTNEYVADLGPTWIWPKYQPTVARWMGRLDLELFPQYEQGHAILDYGPGTTPDERFLPGQDGSVRIKGGSQAIIDKLAAMLPENTLQLDAPVTSISTNNDIEISIKGEASPAMETSAVVIAVPPRIAGKNIQWHPALPSPLQTSLDQTPTWMAPHAKVVAIYDTPFWRDRGLSGRIASNAGPIVEAHDHSGADGSPAAIFGFIGIPHEMRAKLGKDLERQIIDQLQRCFGANSPLPKSIHIEDWAISKTTASRQDLIGPMSHPTIRPNILREPHANGRVFFAGAEVALQSPGLIEGAFDAAERAAENIIKAHAKLRQSEKVNAWN